MLAGLDLQGMLDGCLLHRRDAVPAHLGAAFRDFVLVDGAGQIAGVQAQERLQTGKRLLRAVNGNGFETSAA